MRLNVELVTESNKELILPIHYNYYIQSAIYSALDSDLASFLHEQGYVSDGRKFKLFTFSRLMGRFQMDKGKDTIIFKPPIQLVISSPVDQFCRSLVTGFLTREVIRLGNNNLQVERVNAEKPVVESEYLRIKLLSPVVVYSTLLKPEGTKYTCYFQPGESEFTRLVNKNLKNKYKILYNEAVPEEDIEIKPLKQPRLHVMRYKGFVIKGYSAFLELKGPKSLLQVALNAGLGAKNSMGFGCGEMVNQASNG